MVERKKVFSKFDCGFRLRKKCTPLQNEAILSGIGTAVQWDTSKRRNISQKFIHERQTPVFLQVPELPSLPFILDPDVHLCTT